MWIGWWSLIPVALALLWIWANPRVFPAPRTTRHWISRGVLGERVWLNRDRVPVPAHHRVVPHMLNAVGLVALVAMAAGLIWLHPWLTFVGFVAGIGAKLWFIDRMVWLYEDMRDTDPVYRSWLY